MIKKYYEKGVVIIYNSEVKAIMPRGRGILKGHCGSGGTQRAMVFSQSILTVLNAPFRAKEVT